MNKQDFIEMMQKTQAPLKNMVEMIPDDKLDWAPGEGFMTVGQVNSNRWYSSELPIYERIRCKARCIPLHVDTGFYQEIMDLPRRAPIARPTILACRFGAKWI